MKISTLGYCMKQGIKNIQRNLLFSLASVGTMVACLFLFGIFYSILINMEYEVSDMQKTLKISVFFDEDITEERIAEIGNEIKALDNIDSVNYISAEVAWNSYIKDVYNGDTEYVDAVFGDDNPLENSSSYEVSLEDVSRQDISVKQLEDISNVRKVNSSDGTAKSLSSLMELLSYVSIGIIAILLLVSMFLISNTITIGISVRREEIAIMKLIGAKDIFVRAPFLVEGVLIGLIGSVIPVLILYFVYISMTQYLTEHFTMIANMVTFLPVGKVFVGLVPISLLLGIGVGFFGSLLTIRKHLKI